LGLLALLPACGRDQADKSPAPAISATAALPAPVRPGCAACHPYVIAGGHAALPCTTCHDGDNQAAAKNIAHLDLTARPANPANMQAKCGGCHRQTATARNSMHFTLKKEVNLVRRHFGADQDLPTALDIPVTDLPATPLQLADDLLRRRCLRCHVYYEGDEYSRVRHGTGCAACHLEFQDGKLVSHKFLAKPTDRQCLSCHYGNRVGSDYYGRFDHDFKQEYRTPYQADGSYPPRPYAVEQHRLIPDIHQQAGMTCIDCHLHPHGGAGLATISCAACHLHQAGQPLPAPHLKNEAGQLVITTRREGLELVIPAAAPAALHRQYRNQAACAVCHAQWSFNDQDTNLLRLDNDDYADWDELFVQDSSEVEVALLNGIYGEGTWPPVMTDKITGRQRPGLWLKGFKIRRWASPPLALDQDGKLQVMRPVLDLHLSWVNAAGETIFDAITGQGNPSRPYTPHTIGKAGAFYRQRLLKLPPQKLPKEKQPL
jgi:hypothetical protein